jgi:hypothetical protein
MGVGGKLKGFVELIKIFEKSMCLCGAKQSGVKLMHVFYFIPFLLSCSHNNLVEAAGNPCSFMLSELRKRESGEKSGLSGPCSLFECKPLNMLNRKEEFIALVIFPSMVILLSFGDMVSGRGKHCSVLLCSHLSVAYTDASMCFTL